MYCHFSNIEIFAVIDEFPNDWTQFFKSQTIDSSKRILRSEEQGPDFVIEFVRERNEIVQEFENEFVVKFRFDTTEKLHPDITKGMSPKKIHEVTNFGQFLVNQLKTNQKLIDVGSGAGHLERYLYKKTRESTEIICIESSKSQTESARKWARKLRGCESQNNNIRTINKTFENSSECFSSIESELGDNHRNLLLCGLHSCGDLTNSMISWYLSSNQLSEIAVISCCYHKMKQFPISDCLKNVMKEWPEIASTFSLRLAAQDPFAVWLQKNPLEHVEHAKAFGKRAVLHNVAKSFNFSVKKNTFSKYQNLTTSDVVETLEKNDDFGDDSKREKLIDNLNRDLYQDFDWIEIFSGFQAFLQLPLEFLVMIDKLLKIREIDPKKDPRLVRIFDEIISPRCFLLHSN